MVTDLSFSPSILRRGRQFRRPIIIRRAFMTIRSTRRLILTAATLAAIAHMTGCASTSSAPAQLQAVVGQKPELSTFVQLIKQAGMDDLLTGAAPVTVFAPTNEAFQAVPAATLDKLAKDPQALKAVLQHHAVAGALVSDGLKADSTVLTTLAGTKVSLTKAGDFLTVEEALVTQANLRASNGVVHVVDRVLMPPKK
jgi:uncharacterized surface protein with fasciclin (FAS1) repeats